SPYQVVLTWWDMMVNLAFYNDVGWSTFRILAGFLLAAVVAVPLGLLMGSFEAVRSFFNPPINAIRYMPASAFIPLLILLQGLGEDEKITIIWIGVFFQLVLMVMDIAHHGGGRRRGDPGRRRPAHPHPAHHTGRGRRAAHATTWAGDRVQRRDRSH